MTNFLSEASFSFIPNDPRVKGESVECTAAPKIDAIPSFKQFFVRIIVK